MSVEIEVEGVQEVILELLQRSPVVQALVNQELVQRFPTMPGTVEREVIDEVVCMCQLLVYRRILNDVIG